MKQKLPVVIAGQCKKGLIGVINDGLAELHVVWLDKEYESGSDFPIDAVTKENCYLLFGDEQDIEQTIQTLQKLKQMLIKDKAKRNATVERIAEDKVKRSCV